MCHLTATDEVLGGLAPPARTDKFGVLVFELLMIPFKVAVRRPDRKKVMKCGSGEQPAREELTKGSSFILSARPGQAKPGRTGSVTDNKGIASAYPASLACRPYRYGGTDVS